MMPYHYRYENLDGHGKRRTRVYALSPLPPEQPGWPAPYWEAVTDIPCPICAAGIIRWYEAGYVPGYRVCDSCRRHFLATGKAANPGLMRVGQRRGLPPGMSFAP